MLCFVTFLCNYEGRPCSPEELRTRTPIEGNLTVSSVDPHAFPKPRGEGLSCQPKMVARMSNPERGRKGLPNHFDLFDPQLMSMDQRGFILRGYSRHEDGERVRMAMQAWLVRTSRW